MPYITVVKYSTKEDRQERNRDKAEIVDTVNSARTLSMLANLVVADGGFPDYYEGDEHLYLNQALKRLGVMEIVVGMVPIYVFPGDLLP